MRVGSGLSNRHLGYLLLFFFMGCVGSQDADDASSESATGTAREPVPRVTILSTVQAADPVEFESTRMMAELMRQLGLEVVHRALPWEQQADLVWYSRQDWQMTAWRMVGRPERMDPDEFVVNLFHSSTAETGYNFVGFANQDYDSAAMLQRRLVNREERRQVIYDAQSIIAHELPYLFLVHPKRVVAYRSDVFRTASVIEMQGIGIQNFWTWTQAEPVGEQGRIITNTPRVIQAINPLYVSGDADSRITEIIWDRLMRIGPDGMPQPWAARSVTWEDETNVLVVLRDTMKWHDGRPVTVEDVIFSFEIPAGDEAPMYKPFVEKIESISKVDDKTLRFTLQEPWVAFETASLAKVNIIPKHIWGPVVDKLALSADNAEQHQEKQPIGSGPFRFVAWKPSEEVILQANPDHFSKPRFQQWILRIIPNVESALGQLRNGEINFLMEWEGDVTILREVSRSQPNIEMQATTELGFRLFALNTRVKPFDDSALRRALAHIVPKQAIVKNIFKGYAVPADSYISPAIRFWHNPDLPRYEFGIVRAREVLAKAGYAWDAQGRLLNPTSPSSRRAGTASVAGQ